MVEGQVVPVPAPVNKAIPSKFLFETNKTVLTLNMTKL